MSVKRILHIVSVMNYGGIETFLMNLYRNIDRESIQFDFLVTRECAGVYDDEIVALGGNIYNVPAVRKVGLIKFENSVDIFFKNHPEYDCVHCHMNSWSGFFLKLAKKNNVKVRIAHSHIADPNYTFPGNILRNFWKWRISSCATHMFACSYKAGEWLFGKKYIQSDIFYILNNAINSPAFIYNETTRQELRKKYEINDQFVVGHIGRFNSQKNHKFLIHVFNEIKKIKSNSILFLVGEGELLQEIEDEVNNLGLSESVIFAGTNSEIYNILQIMDVFVFPSLYEGLGIVTIEAQASGLPCIVSDMIPKEAFITNLIESISLEASIDLWSESILRYQDYPRLNKQIDIIKSGYDIQESTKWLENFYINTIK